MGEQCESSSSEGNPASDDGGEVPAVTDSRRCGRKSHPWDAHLHIPVKVLMEPGSKGLECFIANGGPPGCEVSDTSETDVSSGEEDVVPRRVRWDDSVINRMRDKALPALFDFVSLESHELSNDFSSCDEYVGSSVYGDTQVGTSIFSPPIVEDDDIPFDEVPFDEGEKNLGEENNKVVQNNVVQEQGTTLSAPRSCIAVPTSGGGFDPRENGLEEETPFDEQETKQNLLPVIEEHNFEDKAYFSDDDSLVEDQLDFGVNDSRRSFSSIASASQDSVLGLHLLESK